MPRVFVVQDDGSKDFGPALAMGDLVVLNVRDLPVFHSPTSALMEMDRKLKSAGFTKEDYILPAGDPLLIGAAITYAARITGGEVACLKWDNRNYKYFPIFMSLY